MMHTYENLAFEGGGVLGIAYCGALVELEKIGLIQHIKRVAGTSAGSITALLLALRYSSAEILKIFSELDYPRFQDRGRINHLLTYYGYYKGDYATQLFQSWVEEKLNSKEATFQDLIEAGGLDLRVYATNLNSRQIFEFSFAKTKDVSLADAVRASMSVPLFFAAVKINRHLYVDGGTVFDYPLMGFGKDEIMHTLGLAFASSSSVATADQDDEEFGFRQPLQFIQRMVTILERVQSPVLALHEELQQNTILIDTGKVKSLNFKLSAEEKDLLIANGHRAVQEHFQMADLGS